MAESTSDLPGSTLEVDTAVVTFVTESGPTGPTGTTSETTSGTGVTGVTGVVAETNIVAEANIVSKYNLEKYLIFVTNNDIKQVVMVLTNDSSAVQDIINMIDLILADGKIDFGDAPILLALVKKIVAFRTSDLKLSQNLKLEHFLAIIKLVFTILANEGLLKIANTEQFISDITKIIDVIEHGDKITQALPCCAPISAMFTSSKK